MNEELKEYTCNIEIGFCRTFKAKSQDEFIEKVRSDFYEEYGIHLSEIEIVNIKESQ